MYWLAVEQKCRGSCHIEVGAPESWIIEPFKGLVLTPQAFSSSNLVLGPVLSRSGNNSVADQHDKVNDRCSGSHSSWCYREAKTRLMLVIRLNQVRVRLLFLAPKRRFLCIVFIGARCACLIQLSHNPEFDGFIMT
jgi:hypothetical protein